MKAPVDHCSKCNGLGQRLGRLRHICTYEAHGSSGSHPGDWVGAVEEGLLLVGGPRWQNVSLEMAEASWSLRAGVCLDAIAGGGRPLGACWATQDSAKLRLPRHLCPKMRFCNQKQDILRTGRRGLKIPSDVTTEGRCTRGSTPQAPALWLSQLANFSRVSSVGDRVFKIPALIKGFIYLKTQNLR